MRFSLGVKKKLQLHQEGISRLLVPERQRASSVAETVEADGRDGLVALPPSKVLRRVLLREASVACGVRREACSWGERSSSRFSLRSRRRLGSPSVIQSDLSLQVALRPSGSALRRSGLTWGVANTIMFFCFIGMFILSSLGKNVDYPLNGLPPNQSTFGKSAYQTLVSVGSGPLNQLFGCGNSLAFAVGSLAAFVSELVAIVGLAPQFITNGSTTILQRGQIKIDIHPTSTMKPVLMTFPVDLSIQVLLCCFYTVSSQSSQPPFLLQACRLQLSSGWRRGNDEIRYVVLNWMDGARGKVKLSKSWKASGALLVSKHNSQLELGIDRQYDDTMGLSVSGAVSVEKAAVRGEEKL
ncbi:hypothetical protein ZIOFF_020853 [Zingiber officinale]|uniref:Uncharacterized protein n=1 Tax=Zingiber officinale TaxID=94328 RepID=A0A8J5HJ47_ZINOF|nr:hypothetical protein ZIOFF_020853 [Zingiber officinale]